MSNSSSDCPAQEQLRSLIDGTLSESDLAVVQSHVDQCSDCQKQLEMLVVGSESWDAAVGRLREEGPPQDDFVFSDAMRRMKNQEFISSSSDPAAAKANPLEFLTPSDRPDSIGRLGTYEVMQVIGQGGMGVVLKAFDPTLHRVVAVKILAPYLAHNPQARKRFVREAQAIAAVSHDHVISIHAIDESAEQPKIVMQFISGQSLQQKINTEGSLDLKEILRIGMQTASGLSAAHAQGLVHRDVKPSNILLENGIERVKLTDFGLARAADDASLTQSGVIAGTPQYMAPEQANGDAVDHRADLFSLGSVMYAMCVGHSPFRASTTMGVLKRVCHDPPRPIQELNPDIPEWLSQIIMKLLEKKPDDRYQSSREVADLLERWLAYVQQPTAVDLPFSAKTTSTTSAPRPATRTAAPDSVPGTIPWPIRPLWIVVGIVLIGVLAQFGIPEVFVLAFVGWLLTKAYYQWRGYEGGLTSSDNSGRAKSVRHFFFELGRHCGQVGKAIKDNFSFENADQNRLLIVIAWCVAGGIDLFCSVSFLLALTIPRAIAPILLFATPAAFLMGMMSLAVAHLIHRRQNRSIVHLSAFAGLLPLSPGALVRVPCSIVTLFWMAAPDVGSSFESTPWRDTELGHFVASGLAWAKRCLATSIVLSIWSLFCIAALFALYIFYVVPYGPTDYFIHDDFEGQLKPSSLVDSADDNPRVILRLNFTGTGPANGMYPPLETYRRTQVRISCGRLIDQQATLELGDVIRDQWTKDEFTADDCNALFSRALTTPDPRYANSLYQTLKTLAHDGGFSPKQYPSSVKVPNSISEYFHLFRDVLSGRPQSTTGIIKVTKLLDPELFETISPERVNFGCTTSVPFLVIELIAALFVWGLGVRRIVTRRHFVRKSIMPTAAVAT